MTLTTMRDLLEIQLKEIFSAEEQQMTALRVVGNEVSLEELRSVLNTHLLETERQLDRLGSISSLLGIELRGVTCTGIRALVEEGILSLHRISGDLARDLTAIASARRIEHYEISTYESAISLAEGLGENEIVRLLRTSLQEEEQVEQLLMVLAEDLVDEEAEAGSRSGDAANTPTTAARFITS